MLMKGSDVAPGGEGDYLSLVQVLRGLCRRKLDKGGKKKELMRRAQRKGKGFRCEKLPSSVKGTRGPGAFGKGGEGGAASRRGRSNVNFYSVQVEMGRKYNLRFGRGGGKGKAASVIWKKGGGRRIPFGKKKEFPCS